MMQAAASVTFLLVLIFGLLFFTNRDKVRVWWEDFWDEGHNG